MKILRQTDDGFIAELVGTVFNKKIPSYTPDVIVWPHTVQDIVDAIGQAKQENLRISIRSGGHSWSTNHIRKGCMLINMESFSSYEIDQDALTAKAGPGCQGGVLLKALVKRGLFFPAGHCEGVCLGGYLLQGGFGWHSQEFGLACESVIGLDIVTADGEIVHASENENPELYWAARGAGSGFFGVVFQFHLKLFPKPRHTGAMFQMFNLEALDDVMRWGYEISDEVPTNVEFQIQITKEGLIRKKPSILVAATVMTDTVADVRQSLSFLRKSPMKKAARFATPYIPMTIRMLYKIFSMQFAEDRRWCVDNMWTNAPVDEILPFIPAIYDDMPQQKSHIFWMRWIPRARPDMAFSKEDRYYLAVAGSWKDKKDDEKYADWATRSMQKLEHLSTGIQLSDENLNQRVAAFASEESMKRLDEIRNKWDPEQRFYSWHNRL